jgi:O-antigen ligase
MRNFPRERIPGTFLDKPLNFFLIMAVICTTLLSWFQVNSWLIILLTGCRLLDNPAVAIRTAFSQPRFLACFALFLLAVAGLLHTHDPEMAWMHVESKATWVAVPFILCAGPFASRSGFHRLLRAYCRLLAGLCVCCLTVAVVRYARTGYVYVFFYHDLTAVFDCNAVYFSGYVLIALVYLLSASPVSTGRVALIVFFTGMMVLLSSKLLLVLLVVIYGVFLWRRSQVMESRRLLTLTVLIALTFGVVAFTQNPVSRRYEDILYTEHAVLPGGHPAFNGVSLRAFIWRSAGTILNENHTWLFGVSYGDCQRLLDQKYRDAHMSPGYQGYNFHNEYIEVLVSSGIVGAGIFLAALFFLLPPRRKATVEGAFVFLVVVLLAATESTLEMQQPAFFTCFFLLVPWWVAGPERALFTTQAKAGNGTSPELLRHAPSRS